MANVKITDLTAIAAVDLAINDVLPIVDISVDQTKKVEISELRETVAYANDYVTYTQLNANIDAVQSNVQGFLSNSHSISVSANVVPGGNNIFTLGAPDAVFSEVYVGPNSLKLGSLTISDTGGETLTITGASGSQGNLETAAVSGVANLASNVITLEADVDSLQSNTGDLAAGIAGISVDTAAGTETRLNANLDITNDNVTSLTTTVDNFGTSSNSNAAALAASIASLSSVDTATGTETRLNANLDVTNDNVTANFNQLDANINVVQDNVAANFVQLNANLDIVQDNVASIIDGSTPFTGATTFQDQVTVQGNLIITGSQVDLGVTSAQVDDTTLLLAANLTAAQPLTADAGILINRGQDANVFLGFAAYGDHIDFIFTDAPADNVNHYAISYIDVHANSFGAEGIHDPNFTAVHHADRPTTGLIFPTNEINAVIGGAYKANVTASGLEAVAVYSDGVELQANDSATLFSAYSNDFATYTLINANVDVVQDNVATLTTTVDNFGTSSNSNAAALAAGIATLSSVDTATGTETRLNANLDITNDNVASLTTASDAFGTYANSTFSTVANAASLAAGIAGVASTGAFPTGDYGLLDAANSSTDSFGVAIAGLTTFDMKSDPSGSLDTEDLGALT